MLVFLLKGGFFMWPILLCSVISIAVILERLYHFHRAKAVFPNLLTQIKKLLKDGNLAEAEKLCKESPGPVAHIIAVAVHMHRRFPEVREKIVARAGSRELRKLEKNLRTLGIIAHTTPLMGLLGTVTGMIRAFMKIQELGGQVDASVLAGGIWEALLTTAAGLSVAVPTLIAYHYFEGKADDYSAQMKDAVQYLSEWMEPGETKSGI